MRGKGVSARSEATPQALRASSPYTGEPAATEASPPKGRWLGAAETEGWFRRAVKQPLRRFAPAPLTQGSPLQPKPPLLRGGGSAQPRRKGGVGAQ